MNTAFALSKNSRARMNDEAIHTNHTVKCLDSRASVIASAGRRRETCDEIIRGEILKWLVILVMQNADVWAL